MPKILHFASIWKVCFHFNFTKIDPSYFFKREFFFIRIHLFLNSVNMVKKTNHQMLFVLVSNHPDFYLDGPILTSNKKKMYIQKHKYCLSKNVLFYSGEINGQYDPHNHCVYLDSDLIFYNLQTVEVHYINLNCINFFFYFVKLSAQYHKNLLTRDQN